MQQSILIRVTPENFSQWRTAHDECRVARLDYGMTDGPVYRDEKDPNVVLVHLNVENMDNAMGWFNDERFKAGVQRAGKVSREILLARTKV
jgi:hypothetical protein